eukprot:GHVP01029852.1.p1 GENE.GHVP01029852.1~~GHVP01029852.1.p1  ORF type:complete len:352 (+),score=61.45 GHVP01029852.1:2-1057(+)
MYGLNKQDFISDGYISDYGQEAGMDRERNGILYLLEQEIIDISLLRDLSWKGTPSSLRAIVWKLLLGYLSPNKQNRENLLNEKREKYISILENTRIFSGSEGEKKLTKQIDADLPRMLPNTCLLKLEWVQDSIRNILIALASHRPSLGYIQGINDIVVPVFYVFLQEIFEKTSSQSKIEFNAIKELEADCFWCFLAILAPIQKNYTSNHTGVIEKIAKIELIISKMEPELYAHLKKEKVDFLHFGFRWISCLLIREIPLRHIIRMWDTYISEGKESFSIFHPYVCTAFLRYWKEEVLKRGFCEIILLLQNPPVEKLEDKEIETILSEAYYFQTHFPDKSPHFNSENGSIEF